MSKQMHKIINEILTPDDLIIDGGRFAGNIEVNTLISSTGALKSYNLMQTNGSLSDVFKSLSVPIGLLNFGNMFEKHTTFDSDSNSDSNSDTSSNNSSSSDSDSGTSSSSSSNEDDSKKLSNKKTKKFQKGGTKPKKYRKLVARMNHHPDTSVVSDDLFDKFLELAQDLRTTKQQRSTKKSKEHLSKRMTKKHRD